MDVAIMIVHKKAAINDPLLNEFPCFVKIQGNHNHPLVSADALNQLISVTEAYASTHPSTEL
ncbi:hypothetical protein E2C01_059504 [Portunus trituberculatus]|uniref:Uncharacterized protein n=1 Tax=Portunus trituberculatus TaxID=210409 RepID=A0A5B7GZC5_PORTR|nr:hypothetical protein [Portunus trituberculatus]